MVLILCKSEIIYKVIYIYKIYMLMDRDFIHGHVLFMFMSHSVILQKINFANSHA